MLEAYGTPLDWDAIKENLTAYYNDKRDPVTLTRELFQVQQENSVEIFFGKIQNLLSLLINNTNISTNNENVKQDRKAKPAYHERTRKSTPRYHRRGEPAETIVFLPKDAQQNPNCDQHMYDLQHPQHPTTSVQHQNISKANNGETNGQSCTIKISNTTFTAEEFFSETVQLTGVGRV